MARTAATQVATTKKKEAKKTPRFPFFGVTKKIFKRKEKKSQPISKILLKKNLKKKNYKVLRYFFHHFFAYSKAAQIVQHLSFKKKNFLSFRIIWWQDKLPIFSAARK
jgi:hypothetical protein